MSRYRIFTALGIVRYDDKHGQCGKLLGLITFIDGKSLKVWERALHEQCLEIGHGVFDIRYSFTHSEKWGDALSMIERVIPKADHERYDDLRGADEQRGRVAPNSYLGRRIRDGVGRVDDFDNVRRG